MPGIIHDNTDNDILANPQAFAGRVFDKNTFEWIWGDEAPDEDTFAMESGHSFMAGYLKDRDALFDALAYFVGYSELDPGGSLTRVRRWNPAVNPRWPMHRCTQVSVKGVKYDGTTTRLRTYIDSANRLPCTNYSYYRFDVTFAQPQVDYKDDSWTDPASPGVAVTEWDRSITVEPTDETEVISVDGGQYQINAPTHADINTVPPFINGPFLKVYAQRAGLVVKSYGLPANYLLNSYNIPVHFLAAKGRVNSTTFLGLPAGTMLLQGFSVSKQAQPLATRAVGALQFGVTVEMRFGYTDPDRAEPSETLRGWQLTAANYGVGSSGWFGITNKFNGQALYPSFDMNKLLQHWST